MADIEIPADVKEVTDVVFNDLWAQTWLDLVTAVNLWERRLAGGADLDVDTAIRGLVGAQA
ncbi:hypothetical protein [Mycolicibacterium phlei]|uniref:hypothetical protein n=1 Tax=Mycolicibacterium phlei TaxID=1771 RepID=UPI0002FE01ED|nr:hypothetical protein [Mycolicibacterium phlei]MBF4194638.1 hypothetical protein [Mycolicibacterium phlei]